VGYGLFFIDQKSVISIQWLVALRFVLCNGRGLLERTNQLSLLPDKDLLDLCPPIEPYQVTKSLVSIQKTAFSPCSPATDRLSFAKRPNVAHEVVSPLITDN